MPFHRVATTSDVPPGETRLFFVDAKPVLIAHQKDRYYAVDGICPHKGFELEGAVLWDGVVECPWHRYQYDLCTGENRVPKDIYPRELAERIEPIATYRLELRGAEIWVEIEAS
jgi:3-phenylpropionate/trans-cinnamate dioxygenase ferredoxin component